MSRYEASVTTTTTRNLEDAYRWLCSFQNWKGMSLHDEQSHRRICQTTDEVVTVHIFDYRNWMRGSASSTIETLGAPKTIVLSMSLSRQHFIGRLDDMFSVAFGLAKWDDTCNMVFELDDGNDGVFMRRDGRYLINPNEFFAQSLAAFLTFPYDHADSPCRQLKKVGWPAPNENSEENRGRTKR